MLPRRNSCYYTFSRLAYHGILKSAKLWAHVTFNMVQVAPQTYVELQFAGAGTLCPDLSDLHSGNDWLRSTHKYSDASLNKAGYNIVYRCAGHEMRR